MNRSTLVGIACVAAALVFAVWFFLNHERVPEKEWVGMSGEARLRDFLAAQRFAARMGMRVKELRSLPELDSLAPGSALLLHNRRQGLDAGRVSQLLAWVERGGHLIVEAEYLGVADPVLERLEVKRAEHPRRSRPQVVELGEGRRKLTVGIHGVRLEPQAKELRLRVGAPGDTVLASFARGKGLVTVAGSLNFARNNAIGDADHAEFLWHLLRLTPAQDLQVYFRPERLSLWRFLVEHALPVLLAAAALLALWLWRIAPRFGPLAPDAPPARRRLLDHLRASGRYYWASGLRARLVAAARDAALRRVAQAQPDFAAAPPPEQAARLAALAAMSPQDAAQLLAAQGAPRGAEFMQLVHHAQRVHSALERGER